MTDKELRLKAGLSAAAIAGMIGVARSTIYVWEETSSYPETLRITLKGIGATPEIKALEEIKELTKNQLKNIEHQLLLMYEEAANE